jgi:drug/metabolite transporter (DMT)-like permease
MPLFAATIAALFLRRLPGTAQLGGLAIGFAGVLAITLPEATDVDGSVTGVTLVLVAMVSYGLAQNLVVPLQQRYGSLPVLLRALALATVLTTPYGIWSLRNSTFEWRPALAIVALGVFSTGVAYVFATTLVGRAGPTRGPAAVYLIPVVSLAEGVLILSERAHVMTFVGTVLVLGGAWLTSRAEGRR